MSDLRSGIQPGETIGARYCVLYELGRSRWSRTYLAREGKEKESGNRCVLKVFSPSLNDAIARHNAVDWFFREARLLGRLKHSQMARLKHFFQQEERHDRRSWFCVYEWVEGLTYRELLQLRGQQGRSFRPLEAIAFLQQVLPALAYLHDNGATHGNLAPEKLVLRQSDGLPVLVDSGGFTRVAAAIESGSFYRGKRGYAPPEQVQAGVVLPQSDLYALGAMVFALLLGRDPQPVAEPTTPSTWNWEQIPASEAFREILQQMLAPKPGDRFVSAGAVLEALDQLPSATQGTVSPTSPPAPTTAEPFSGRMRSAAIALLQLGFVGLFCLSSGTMGWWAGRVWLARSMGSHSSEEPDELPEPKALSFLPADDPEPEPPASLPVEERERKLALRDRRLRAGIDYRFFRSLTNEVFGVKYPSQRGRRHSFAREDAAMRQRWDAIADQLLERLAFLSLPARQQLGRYDPQDSPGVPSAAERLNLSRQAFFDLVEAQFLARFPEGEDLDSEEDAIAQVQQAMIFDELRTLAADNAITQIAFDVNTPNRQLQGTLELGEGKVFLLELESGQQANIVLGGASGAFFGVYSPEGSRLLETPQQRSWSGRAPETGTYQLVLVGSMSVPLDYQLFLTRN
ncbi:MAG: protein kinase [Cyanobacteriota bacterium]|nr:protein kinase [Cyanobacteriota bacterium]